MPGVDVIITSCCR